MATAPKISAMEKAHLKLDLIILNNSGNGTAVKRFYGKIVYAAGRTESFSANKHLLAFHASFILLC